MNLRLLKIFFLGFALVKICTLYGQKEGGIVIFGEDVGIDFNFSPPRVFSTGTTFFSEEGSATASDADGNLLFYTNGNEFWNRNHQKMPGSGGPDFTTTTQVAIARVPQSTTSFYVFTVGYQGGPLQYSLVDMNEEEGLGNLVFSKTTLYDSAVEKLSVIERANTDTLWLVSHEYGSDRFRSFVITPSGLDTAAIVSATGLTHEVVANGTTAIGYLKHSLDGKKLASAIYGRLAGSSRGALELFDFNDSSGVVSNPMLLSDTAQSSEYYGVEFSPDGSKLYATSTSFGNLIQYNLAADSSEIISSAVTIASGIDGALQLAPNGKIYIAGTVLSSTLDVIHQPNELGTACEFQASGLDLEGRRVVFGLPRFRRELKELNIIAQGPCEKSPFQFSLDGEESIANIRWDFGDGNSIEEFTTPQHTYGESGVYTISTAITRENGSTASGETKVFVRELPTFSLGKDSTICDSASITLNPTAEALYTYTWSDGSVGAQFTTNQPGNYWAIANDSYCESTDTISISTLNSPSFSLEDTVLCQEQVLDISLESPETAFIWDDGVAGGQRSIAEAGVYEVVGENFCGSLAQSITVTYLPYLSLDLGDDQVLCFGESITLDAFSESASYLWNDNSTEPEFTINEEGTFFVSIFNKCEELTDSIAVDEFKFEDLKIPNVFTPNGDGFNDQFEIRSPQANSAIRIYDRSGKEVFSSNQYQNDWSAENLPSGTYFYWMLESCTNNEIKGWIQVLR